MSGRGHRLEVPVSRLCSESKMRSEMTDQEFWEHVFGRSPEEEKSWADYWWSMDGPDIWAISCARCGMVVEVSDQAPFGDWTPGRWAWSLQSPIPFNEPVPMRGRQGIWYVDEADLPPAELAKIRGGLDHGTIRLRTCPA